MIWHGQNVAALVLYWRLAESPTINHLYGLITFVI